MPLSQPSLYIHLHIQVVSYPYGALHLQDNTVPRPSYSPTHALTLLHLGSAKPLLLEVTNATGSASESQPWSQDWPEPALRSSYTGNLNLLHSKHEALELLSEVSECFPSLLRNGQTSSAYTFKKDSLNKTFTIKNRSVNS